MEAIRDWHLGLKRPRRDMCGFRTGAGNSIPAADCRERTEMITVLLSAGDTLPRQSRATRPRRCSRAAGRRPDRVDKRRGGFTPGRVVADRPVVGSERGSSPVRAGPRREPRWPVDLVGGVADRAGYRGGYGAAVA